MHTDHRSANAKREESLVVPMHNERACSVEDSRRSGPASGIPHSIGVRRHAELGSENRLRRFQRFPTLAEGL